MVIYRFIQTKNIFYCICFHVCETQRTRMHATDTTATPNSRQMAVAACERSTCINPDDNLTAAKKRPPATEAWSCATLPSLIVTFFGQ